MLGGGEIGDGGGGVSSLKREASIEISRPAAPPAGSHIIRPSPSPLEEGAENGQNRVWMADDEKISPTHISPSNIYNFRRSNGDGNLPSSNHLKRASKFSRSVCPRGVYGTKTRNG